MPLPAPNLDDRRFQQLVDDAKRLVQQRCPEWTDHNVHDPGVTLIELFAWMTDQLLYRLNRVPDLNYVKFLEFIGVRLFPPTASRANVTFWLSASQPETLRIPAGTRVATPRTDADEPISFTTTTDLDIVACSLDRVASSIEDEKIRDHTDGLRGGKSFLCFDQVPKPGDNLLIGLSNPVPSCAVTLRFDCEIEGVGVDPNDPPLEWEAWDGEKWAACEVDRDETGGLNRAGDVVVHVASHEVSVISRRRAGWIRCRVVEAAEGQPAYSASPKINALTASTVGGTIEAVHADIVNGETFGTSEGIPGQRFQLRQRPVVPGSEGEVLEVASDGGWEEWTRVEDFSDSGGDDKHFLLDPLTGEVVFGPAVREQDGSLRQFGAIPPKGSVLRIRSYRTGGGRRGNVAKGTISIIRSAIPFVSSVENRHPAAGGVDGEDVENAKLRGPIFMRTRNRAVTAEDYEELAREAAPEVARVRCVSAGDGADAGGVRVLIVPAAADDEIGRLNFEQLIPAQPTLAQIADYLDQRRVVGARLMVEPPEYQGMTVVARLRARARSNPNRVQSQALESLYRYFHPISGGSDGKGWPFGRTVHSGEVYSVLQRVPGVEFVEDVRLFAANPVTAERGEAVQRIDLGAHSLIYSYEHQVLAEGE